MQQTSTLEPVCRVLFAMLAYAARTVAPNTNKLRHLPLSKYGQSIICISCIGISVKQVFKKALYKAYTQCKYKQVFSPSFVHNAVNFTH